MNKANSRTYWGTLLLLPLLLSGMPGCDRASSLDRIQRQGTLTVVTYSGPATYRRDGGRAAGFEYTLARRFADYLGVELVVREARDLQELFRILGSGQADVAAAGIAATPARQRRYLFAPPYFEARPVLVYRTAQKRPRALADAYDQEIAVVAHSAHAEVLELLSRQHPGLRWRASGRASTIDLLRQVERRELSYTVVNSHELALYQAYFPEVKAALALGEAAPVAWALSRNRDQSELQEKLADFFAGLRRDGALERLKERYFGHTSHADQADSRTFTRSFRRRFPHYEALVREVAGDVGLDWKLLAAISYRESHWKPGAVSATGVRGMMMLTRRTAAEMGVADREDPEQSLRGGARYFKRIWQRIPGDIAEPDKTWFALAAYNLGMSHLNDARILTERQGADPHRWPEVMARLPLLERRQHYQTLRHGYARGSEAALYVQHVRHYYHLLQWLETDWSNPQPAPAPAPPGGATRLGKASLAAL
jgi:membrane-bound lytic murein transglycosylase F